MSSIDPKPSRHMKEFTDAELNELRLGIDALLRQFLALHPDACVGCVSEATLITLGALLRGGEWTFPDVIESLAPVWDVNVERHEDQGGTPPTIH